VREFKLNLLVEVCAHQQHTDTPAL